MAKIFMGVIPPSCCTNKCREHGEGLGPLLAGLLPQASPKPQNRSQIQKWIQLPQIGGHCVETFRRAPVGLDLRLSQFGFTWSHLGVSWGRSGASLKPNRLQLSQLAPNRQSPLVVLVIEGSEILFWLSVAPVFMLHWGCGLQSEKKPTHSSCSTAQNRSKQAGIPSNPTVGPDTALQGHLRYLIS